MMQLWLSSCLFSVGFSDNWCQRYIWIRIAKSLGYANATGFNYHDADTALLDAILTPYGKWRHPTAWENRDDTPFSPVEMIRMTRTLLDHVQCGTGHPHSNC